MKKTLALTLALTLASCATSDKDIRKLGPRESIDIAKPYNAVAHCVEKQLDEKYDSAMYFKKTNHGDTTMLYREEYNGGYWIQIDKQKDGTAKVASYISDNMMFADALSTRLMGYVKKGCL